MPSRPMRPTLAIVSSTSSLTRPSPGLKTRFLRLMSRASSAVPTAVAILAAQEDLAPSQTMPPMVLSVLVTTPQMVS